MIVFGRWVSRKISMRTPSRYTHQAFSQSSGKFWLPPESDSARFRLYSEDHQIFAAMRPLPSWLPPVTENIRPPSELVSRSGRSPDANHSLVTYKCEFQTFPQLNLVHPLIPKWTRFPSPFILNSGWKEYQQCSQNERNEGNTLNSEVEVRNSKRKQMRSS